MLWRRKPILLEVNEEAVALPLQGCCSHRLSYALMQLLGVWGIIIIIIVVIIIIIIIIIGSGENYIMKSLVICT